MVNSKGDGMLWCTSCPDYPRINNFLNKIVKKCCYCKVSPALGFYITRHGYCYYNLECWCGPFRSIDQISPNYEILKILVDWNNRCQITQK